MTLTVRTATVSGAITKGSRLTNLEMDENWNHTANFTQTGSGAIAEAIRSALLRLPHTAQYDTAANFNTAVGSLSGTTGLGNVRVNGVIRALDGSESAPAYSFISATGAGMLYDLENSAVRFVVAGSVVMSAFAGNFAVAGASAQISLGATPAAVLVKDTDRTLALRATGGFNIFRVYGTFTDASNYERGALNMGADYVELAAETAGTGDDNLDVRLTPAGTGNVRFGTHTALGAETVSGFITIKDAAGNARKVAVVS